METRQTITPVFVIGMDRAGTKWLTSILRRHPDIAAPESPKGGVFEANFESFDYHFPAFSGVDDYIAMVELFSLTGIFSKLDIEKEYFYNLVERPANYFELFGIAMTEYARRRGSKYWIQKASPLSTEKLTKYFPDAYYLVIKRNLIDNIKSKVALSIIVGAKRGILQKTLHYAFQEKLCGKLMGSGRGLVSIDYHQLKSKQESIISQVMNGLNLNYADNMVIVPAENLGHSSFREAKQRDAVLSKQQVFGIRLTYLIARLVPFSVQRAMYRLRNLNFARSRGRIVRGIFYPQAEKYGLTYEKKKLS